MRQELHGRLITADELEVCGAFLINKINMKQTKDDRNVFALTPDLTDIFDYTYQRKGLGFENEKTWTLKQAGSIFQLEVIETMKQKTFRQRGRASHNTRFMPWGLTSLIGTLVLL
ncbi:MAG: hypothetical protein IPL12_14880 [Bacteroidetes bacterium]|nr:hypothetical protein [Bacteroidota bacterium]